MVPTGGELDDAKMAELLRLRIETGERSPDSFVHEMDVYSGEPEHIISGLNHAPGTDLGDGKGKAWCFYSPASWLESAGVGHKRRRKRQVGGARGGDGVRCWHQEKKGRMFGSSPHGSAYSTTFSYVLKEKNPVGSAKPFSFKRLGWSMTEIIDAGAADNLMFCKLYRSTRTNPEMARTVRRQRGTAGVEVDRKFTMVMKFTESSISSAVGMKEVANLIRRFTKEEKPVVVLSPMRNTTNNLLLAAQQARSCNASMVCEIPELQEIKTLHLSTVHELQLDSATVSGTLDLLEKHLMSVARTKELAPMVQAYILSFGERLSTGILSAYLNKLEIRARQYDELDLGLMTIDKCMDIVEATYFAIAERLQRDWIVQPAVPILTSFLGKEWGLCTIGTALGSREIQIWTDVDGVLTCDPNVCSNAKPVPFLTFDEAAELAYFGSQIARPAREGGIPVRVKNLYDPHKPGTLITKTRDMCKNTLTGIVLESNITVLHIESIGELGQHRCLANVLSILEGSGISADYMAIDKGKMSMVLDPSKLLSCELIEPVVEQLRKTAVVHVLQHRSVVSLVGNIQMSTFVLGKASNVLCAIDVKVQMILQGSSDSTIFKVSFVVHDSEANNCVQAFHAAFFENGLVSEVEGAENKCQIPADSSTTVSSGIKGKAEGDLAEATPSVQERADTETRLHPPPVFHSITGENISRVAVDHRWDPSLWSANMERMLSDSEEIRSDDTDEDWCKYLSGIVDGHGNWISSGGNDGAGPSGVVAGEPEDGEFPELHEQPANAPAASGNYP